MTRTVARHFILAGFSPLFLVLALSIRVSAVTGAEIRGIVNLKHIGLFGQAPSISEAVPLSVAIFPLEGATPVAGEPKTHSLAIQGNQTKPIYLAITRGDRVRFENHDDVYHELFSITAENPFVLRLATHMDGEIGSAEVQSAPSATWHVFCRIHAKTNARIGVLDTPYIKVIRRGEPFAFRKLSSGKWRVRIATLGARTRFVETLARTSAPALHETLTVREGALGRGTYTARQIGVADLFPAEPGS